MAQPTRTKIHAEEYFQLEVYAENNLIQLIDGEVIVGMPPIPKHQDIVRELTILIGLHARQHGGKMYSSPIELYLDENNVYEPDVLYIKPDGKCEVSEKRLTGAPNLIIEILSPSTAKHDKTTKFDAYQRHGVDEYWIIDPAHDIIDVWTLSDNSLFAHQGAFAIGDEFISATLSESVKVEDIFNL